MTVHTFLNEIPDQTMHALIWSGIADLKYTGKPEMTAVIYRFLQGPPVIKASMTTGTVPLSSAALAH